MNSVYGFVAAVIFWLLSVVGCLVVGVFLRVYWVLKSAPDGTVYTISGWQDYFSMVMTVFFFHVLIAFLLKKDDDYE